ncbi:MAG: Rv2231c family pyridoxal phosphate-dependent protein CobC [Actinomycetota bacterium]|nr:Rv2231c family pyridoxal phosphate-dependent protein CobC [Actinomycetota bacterium]
MSRILVLGGTKSGKSTLAECLAAEPGRPVVVVATAEVTDQEMAERVVRHRERRPSGWTTVEGDDLLGAVEAAGSNDTVLVDALDTWLAGKMGAAGLWTDETVAPLGSSGRKAVDAMLAELDAFWAAAGRRAGRTVLVCGQPGWAPVPPDASTRRYLDAHGEAVQRLSATAERVVLTVAGRVLELSAATPRSAAVAASVLPALREHGDKQAPPGTLDLAVNVRADLPPWLRQRLGESLDRLTTYPDTTNARAAAATRHGRPAEECLPLDGAAEAFWLLAATLRPRLAACVHPSFTEPEAALRAHGHRVVRVFRDRDTAWGLDPAAVPADADLVVLGRPDNPTGALDPVHHVAALTRPGRTVVVDESFAEFLPDEHATLAARRDLPGLVVVRSLTKLWGLPGLRVGYLLAAADLVYRLDSHRQPWPVNALAAEALVACVAADDERRARARRVATERKWLMAGLRTIPGLVVWPSVANFLLLAAPGVTDLRQRLLARGVAVRRGDTFPGLGSDHVRVAVSDLTAGERLVAALREALSADQSSGAAAGSQASRSPSSDPPATYRSTGAQ